MDMKQKNKNEKKNIVEFVRKCVVGLTAVTAASTHGHEKRYRKKLVKRKIQKKIEKKIQTEIIQSDTMCRCLCIDIRGTLDLVAMCL